MAKRNTAPKQNTNRKEELLYLTLIIAAIATIIYSTLSETHQLERELAILTDRHIRQNCQYTHNETCTQLHNRIQEIRTILKNKKEGK